MDYVRLNPHFCTGLHSLYRALWLSWASLVAQWLTVYIELHSLYRALWLSWASLVAQWLSGSCQRRRPRFDPWVRKIPWRRKLQPTTVFLPGKSHGQKGLVGYTPWDHRESATTEQLTEHTHSCIVCMESVVCSLTCIIFFLSLIIGHWASITFLLITVDTCSTCSMSTLFF